MGARHCGRDTIPPAGSPDLVRGGGLTGEWMVGYKGLVRTRAPRGGVGRASSSSSQEGSTSAARLQRIKMSSSGVAWPVVLAFLFRFDSVGVGSEGEDVCRGGGAAAGVGSPPERRPPRGRGIWLGDCLLLRRSFKVVEWEQIGRAHV